MKDYEADKNEILRDLGNHHFWLARLLIRMEFWQFLVPFPLPELVRFVSGFLTRKKVKLLEHVHSSTWITITFVLSFFAYKSTNHFAETPRMLQHAADGARQLFTATFLIGTIMSVSVATPGQAILKALVDDDPDFAVDFVAPFLWSLLWGLIGAVGLSVIYYLTPSAQKIIYCISIYGGLMQINTLLHTVRTYIFGILAYQSQNRGK